RSSGEPAEVSRAGTVRRPAVAGAFYPGEPDRLRELVRLQLAEAARHAASAGHAAHPEPPLGILVPHAGLTYSGVVAASAWRLAAALPVALPDDRPLTVVLLGTNHRASWLDGIGAWPAGSWQTPIGRHAVDEDLAASIVELGPPFVVDPDAHLQEHSVEVQLPFLSAVAPDARIVPLATSDGIGPEAVEAGRRLGEELAMRAAAGSSVLLAISTDMAHYPSGIEAEAVTNGLRPAITALDPVGLAAAEACLRERAAMGRGPRGLACGMCGIEPAVVGLAALRAMGALRGTVLGAATSADAGGPPDRTVGYLAVRFD
ncbi:MAG TPA: AmmeMemoRadiSam system protein B, partial [Candidatus Limnocylindrales bacterium]|nr:AmmeMemoRadiSam system protein B [Candidatus Limnocylindrales bacterium]